MFRSNTNKTTDDLTDKIDGIDIKVYRLELSLKDLSKRYGDSIIMLTEIIRELNTKIYTLEEKLEGMNDGR